MLSIITIIENTTNAIPLTYGTMMRSGGSRHKEQQQRRRYDGKQAPRNVLVGVDFSPCS